MTVLKSFKVLRAILLSSVAARSSHIYDHETFIERLDEDRTGLHMSQRKRAD